MAMSVIVMFSLLATTSIAQAPSPQPQACANPDNTTSFGGIIAPSALPCAYPLSLTPQDAQTENQIRNTLAHYPLAIDGKNFAALDLVFTDDAVANYSAPLNVLTGLTQIESVLQQSLAPVRSQHAYSTQVIEIERAAKTARSVTYFTSSLFGTGNLTGKVSLDHTTLGLRSWQN